MGMSDEVVVCSCSKCNGPVTVKEFDAQLAIRKLKDPNYNPFEPSAWYCSKCK